MMIPREGTLRLYKRLVQDDVESNRHQIRNFVRSSERERLRTLNILGLLPSKIGNKTNVCDTKSKKKKVKMKSKGNVSSKLSKSEIIKIQQSSPYMKKSMNTKQKPLNRIRTSKSSMPSSLRPFQEDKEKSNRVTIPNDYIWHPVFEQNTKITDVVGYYSRQYHKHQHKNGKR